MSKINGLGRLPARAGIFSKESMLTQNIEMAEAQNTEYRFRYRRDRRTRRLTWITLVLIAAVFTAIAVFVREEYVRAWIIVLLLTVLLLYVLSIPRHIKVDREALEIHCVVEMTRIPIADINSVRKVTRQDTGKLTLLLGSYGFFGYYGYYANLHRWETLKVYASELDNLVEINDIYEDRYLVSCREADRLIEMVMQAKLIGAGDETGDPPREV